jgi:hypothetical protein
MGQNPRIHVELLKRTKDGRYNELNINDSNILEIRELERPVERTNKISQHKESIHHEKKGTNKPISARVLNSQFPSEASRSEASIHGTSSTTRRASSMYRDCIRLGVSCSSTPLPSRLYISQAPNSPLSTMATISPHPPLPQRAGKLDGAQNEEGTNTASASRTHSTVVRSLRTIRSPPS